jgi:inorganic pyrophosphatase
MEDFSGLGPFDGDALNVIIETPQGSRNKYDFDPARGLFRVSGVLPLGAVFPFDFGLVPATRGEDGDPLDVLVLMEEPTFTGCFVAARLVGVIEAEQTECDGQAQRNDRLIAVAAHSHTYRGVTRLEDLDPALLEEVEHFFVSYNQAKGKEFRPAGRGGAARARRLVEEGRVHSDT